MSDDCTFSPIFIVGSPRSGTSALVLALREGAGFHGYNEGHLAPLIAHMFRAIDRYYEVKGYLRDDESHLIRHVRPEDVKKGIGEAFEAIYRTYHTSPPRRWAWRRDTDSMVEKTGDEPMIRTAPILQWLWPDSRFIFAKRRGIENVISRMKKFPEISFEQHCIQWTACMKGWLEVRPKLANKMEVDQMDIATDPEGVAARMAEFLTLDSDTEDEIARVFANRRPEALTDPSYKLSSLSDVAWTDAEKSFFRDTCRQSMEAFGYDLEA